MVILFEGDGRREIFEESQRESVALNLIIIRLSVKYLCHFHDEVFLGIFWINTVLNFWPCVEFRPPTLYRAYTVL